MADHRNRRSRQRGRRRFSGPVSALALLLALALVAAACGGEEDTTAADEAAAAQAQAAAAQADATAAQADADAAAAALAQAQADLEAAQAAASEAMEGDEAAQAELSDRLADAEAALEEAEMAAEEAEMAAEEAMKAAEAAEAAAATTTTEAMEEEAPTTTEAMMAEEMGTVTIAVPTDIATFDPNGVTGVRDLDMYINLYAGLTRHKVIPSSMAEGHYEWDRVEVEPNLAESIDISDDGTVYTFKIHEGLSFPSGNPLSAKDFHYSWERGLAHTGSITDFELGVAEISDMNQVQLLDDYTLEVTLPRPNPRILRVFSLSVMSAVDSELLKSQATEDDPWADNYARSNPAGYGPYMLVERDVGTRMVFEPNPGWWDPESSGRSKIIYQVVPEEAQRLLLVQQGAIDLAYAMSARTAQRAGDNVQVLDFPTFAQRYLGLNQTKAPYNDLKVRQALAWAIDYDRIIAEVYFGSSQRLLSPFPTGHEGWVDSWPYSQDIEKAKALLAEAGYPDGFDAEMLVYGDLPEIEASTVLIQSDLKQIGINLGARSVTGAEFFGLITPGTDDFDMAIIPCTPWLPEVWYTSNLLLHSGTTCSITYNNPVVDQLVADMKTAATTEEAILPAQRAQALWEQDIGFIPIAQPNQIQILSKDLKGFLLTNEDESVYFAFLEK
jgi:peptide/nickel transport system substrate-binding protein